MTGQESGKELTSEHGASIGCALMFLIAANCSTIKLLGDVKSVDRGCQSFGEPVCTAYPRNGRRCTNMARLKQHHDFSLSQ
jgi:hypothetical protein